MTIFPLLRVFSMGDDLYLILHSAFPSSLSKSSVISSRFSPSFEYVVAEKIFYLQCTIYVLIKGREYIEILTGRHDIRIPFFICVLSLWAVFWYTHPRSLVESGGGEFYFFCFLFNLYITIPFDYDSHNQYKLPYICMLWLNCNAVHSSLSTTL